MTRKNFATLIDATKEVLHMSKYIKNTKSIKLVDEGMRDFFKGLLLSIRQMKLGKTKIVSLPEALRTVAHHQPPSAAPCKPYS